MGKTCSNIVKRMLCTMLTIVGMAITVCGFFVNLGGNISSISVCIK